MLWNYRPYTWYWCMERGNRKEYKQKWEEFAVTNDNACTIHCAKQSHILRHFSNWFLSKVCWRWGTLCEGSIVEGQLSGQSFNRYCVAVTCHTSPRYAQWLAPHRESLNHQSLHLMLVSHRCTWTQNRFVLSTLWPIPVLRTFLLASLLSIL